METGSISKPLAPLAALANGRLDPLTATGAVKTELAFEAAVQQASSTPAIEFSSTAGAEFRATIEEVMREAVERTVEADPRTRELVFQAISKETGAVIRQLPDEATLRLRAYVQEMRAAEDKERGGSDVARVEKIA